MIYKFFCKNFTNYVIICKLSTIFTEVWLPGFFFHKLPTWYDLMVTCCHLFEYDYSHSLSPSSCVWTLLLLFSLSLSRWTSNPPMIIYRISEGTSRHIDVAHRSHKSRNVRSSVARIFHSAFLLGTKLTPIHALQNLSDCHGNNLTWFSI